MFKNTNKGFTLVELIVSLGLFIIVITISTGTLLSLSDMSRKVQSTRVAIDNLNLALESMSKEIRVGISYYCNPFPALTAPINFTTSSQINDCGLGGTSVAFLAQDGSTTVYRINGAVIERSRDGGSTFSSVTSSEINITRLNFYVIGTGNADIRQPRVIIVITGTAGVKFKSEFKIQTTVTQRAPDL